MEKAGLKEDIAKKLKALEYLAKFDPEQIWNYYQNVIAHCTDAAWTTLTPENKDIFLHLKFRSLSLQKEPQASTESELRAELERVKEENSMLKARLDTIEEMLRRQL